MLLGFITKERVLFSKHMQTILQSDWYWERVEAQFRTSLHTHGALKMHNDNNLVENTHLALIGFLAKEKLDHMKNINEVEKNIPVMESTIFTDKDIQAATVRINKIFRKVITLLVDDFCTHKSESTCYYVGVAFDQENENSKNVISGKQEQQTSIKQGMLNPNILQAMNNLSPVDAYTLETKIIKFMKKMSEKNTLNKSVVFGLGNRPSQWRSMRCTVTLLRGTYRHTRYRAYPELDKIFASCTDDVELEVELKKLIEQGNIAEAKVRMFADFLISTWNPSFDKEGKGDYLPGRRKDEPISSHPCAQCYQAWSETTAEEYGIDYTVLVNRLQSPHNCEKGGCNRTSIKTHKDECRFHFPRPIEKLTHIEFKPHGKNPFGDILYRAHIFTRRNDPLVNNHIPVFLSAWRANMDFQIIMDPVACAQYIAKYTAKAEKSSKKHNTFMKDILKNAKCEDTPLDLFRRMMLRGESQRDMGAPEIKFMNLQLPLVSTNITFRSVSLNGRRLIKRQNEYDPGKFQPKSLSGSYKCIRDFYAQRQNIEFNAKCQKALFKYGNIPINDDKDMLLLVNQDQLNELVEKMNFNDFCYLFKESKDILSPRLTYSKDRKFVIRFWPHKKPYGHGARYREYCKYQLIRHKPWFDTPLDLCKDFMPDDIDEINRFSIELTAYTKAYHAWLESSNSDIYLATKKREKDLEQAVIAHRIWKVNDDALFENDKARVPDQNLSTPDWMDMANFATINEEDIDVNHVQRDLPWDEWEQEHVTEMHRLRAPNYIEEYIRSRTLKTPLEDIDITNLNSEQRLAYDIVVKHYHGSSSDALRMIIHGTAGTGKTHIIKALKYEMRDSIFLTATTGKAAAIINGTTTYHTLALPVEYKKPLGLTAAALLQERFKKFRKCPSKCYIVIDEMSMLGSGIFNWVDKRAREAFVNPYEPFGGASIILVGDFAQLPPVKDKALFDSNTKYQDQHEGHFTYMSKFKTVVILRQNMRVHKEEREFMETLLRVRDGTTTLQDHEYFSKRFISNIPKTTQFENSVHLNFARKPTNRRNIDRLYCLEKPIMKINAKNVPTRAKGASSELAKNTPVQIILAVNADIIITKNIWPEAGLINGTFGTIWEVIYAKNTAPPDLPIALLVQIPSFRGKSFIDEVPNIVPIVPVTSKFQFGEQELDCTRTQLPVMLAYALTVHKAQGSTLPKAVVDLGPTEPSIAPGLAFVSLSRCRSINDYLFVDWDVKRLNRIRRHVHFAKRMLETQRLELLFQQTRYDFNKTDISYEHIIDTTIYQKQVNGTAPKEKTLIRSVTRKRLDCERAERPAKRRKLKAKRKRSSNNKQHTKPQKKHMNHNFVNHSAHENVIPIYRNLLIILLHLLYRKNKNNHTLFQHEKVLENEDYLLYLQ